MHDRIQRFLSDLKDLRRKVKAEPGDRIAKGALCKRADQLGSQWFDEVEATVGGGSVDEQKFTKYRTASKQLIKISAPNNLKSSYVRALDSLIKPMRNELIIPLKAGPAAHGSSPFTSFVASLKNPEESAYFTEALSCAKHGYLRAAAVMAWCAAIDRIHRKIELTGFATFNVASAQMASQQKGRFKKFNQVQNVTGISDLREVFDTTILWIIEGMGLIDSNQHTRLRGCFEMRCQSAHPGDAPITEYNLMSLFSDIEQIVLDNRKFDT
jgi:hypothetical protein